MSIPEIRGGGGVLGEKVQGPRRKLDTFDLPNSVDHVTYTSDEVSSMCPITGQPDWYEVTISLWDTKVGLESKSVKLYLQSFRDEGQFCEAFADRIANDVQQACDNRGTVEVEVRQKPRGGVSITGHAVYEHGMPRRDGRLL